MRKWFKLLWAALLTAGEAIYGEKHRWIGPASYVWGLIVLIISIATWIMCGWKTMLIVYGICVIISLPFIIFSFIFLRKFLKGDTIPDTVVSN